MGSCLPVRVGEDDYGEKAPFCLKPSYCCGAYPASNNVVVKFPAGHKSGVQPSVDVVNNFSVERTVVPDVAESRESLVQPIVKELRFFFRHWYPRGSANATVLQYTRIQASDVQMQAYRFEAKADEEISEQLPLDDDGEGPSPAFVDELISNLESRDKAKSMDAFTHRIKAFRHMRTVTQLVDLLETVVSARSLNLGLRSAIETSVRRTTSVIVWAEILDISTQGAETELLFHYTTEFKFNRVVANVYRAVALEKCLQEEGLFGKGIYCSKKAPDEFENKLGLLQNLIGRNLEGEKNKSLTSLLAFKYCIPILADRDVCRDVQSQTTPEMKHGVGKDVNGEPCLLSRDLWVIQLDASDTNWNLVGQKLEALLRRRIPLLIQVHGQDNSSVWSGQLDLARLLILKGAHSESEALTTRVLRSQHSILGLESQELMETMVLLGQALLEQDMTSDAELVLRNALALDEAKPGRVHPRKMRITMNLARAFLQRKSPCGIGLLRSLNTRQQSLYGPRSTQYMESLRLLAEYSAALKETSEANDQYEQLVKVSTDVLGPTDPFTLQSSHSYAKFFVECYEKPDAGIAMMRDVLKLQESQLGSKHPNTISTMIDLAKSVLSEDSQKLYCRALSNAIAGLGADHPDTLELARLIRIRGGEKSSTMYSQTVSEAIRARRHALKECETLKGKHSEEYFYQATRLAHVLINTRAEDSFASDARDLLRCVYKGRKELFGMSFPDTLDAMANLATVLLCCDSASQDSVNEAITLLSSMLPLHEDMYGDRHVKTCLVRGNLDKAMRRSQGGTDVEPIGTVHIWGGRV